MTPAAALAWCEADLRARDRDRWLAVLWAPARRRHGLTALFALDLALWDVVATTRDSRIGEIRLAWWRERLEALDEAPPPAQPALVALHAHALDCGVSGPDLAGLEDGALHALGGDPAAAAALRGPRLFALAARCLGATPTSGIGHAWAAGEAARAGAAIAEPALPGRTAAGLRPLLGLDRLGVRDIQRRALGRAPEARATPARQLILARASLLG